MPATNDSNSKSLTEWLARQANLQVAALIAEPTAATAWSALQKADYTGYVDASYTNNIGADWTTPANGLTSNVQEISFPANSGGTASSSITHFAVRSGTSGDEFRWGPLSSAVVVNPGESAKFAIGALLLEAK